MILIDLNVVLDVIQNGNHILELLPRFCFFIIAECYHNVHICAILQISNTIMNLTTKVIDEYLN